MKRIFIILCLITICNISYADIASTTYVDGVVATKQDTITDIATIRSGAAAGATAVQPSSLSTVATSGSYNDLSNKPTIPTVPTTISSFTNDSGYITNSYHDSTKQDKLPTGPSGGRYNLVWNGNTGNFVFELVPHSQCPNGTYDIGFDQCIDPTIDGTTHTVDTAAATWTTTFPYGIISGISVCNDTSGSYRVASISEQQETGGVNCWCKMTSPFASSVWMFYHDFEEESSCFGACASNCASSVRTSSSSRTTFFSSVVY